MKEYIIYAGVNGAGKSTLYNLAPCTNCVRINTDEIVRDLGDWRDINLQLRAGKIAINKIKQCISEGISFNQETTLCGYSIINNIKAAKNHGYRIIVHYVGVNSVQIAKDRIADRVRKGGHGIPDSTVEKRYNVSMSNLQLLLPICDHVLLYDNSVCFEKIAEYQNGRLIWSAELPDNHWFTKYVSTTVENSIHNCTVFDQ